MSATGIGYDCHRFAAGRALVLGGVHMEHDRGLEGHSDADVLTHAISDALLGACALGDLGAHFPDTDPQWAGVDSLQLLRAVAELVRANGWAIANVDCSVVCEIPKLAPQRDEMQRRLSHAAGGPVTVKGRRAEGLGAIGRSEGVACWAVALVTATDGRATRDGAPVGDAQRSDSDPTDVDETSNPGDEHAGNDERGAVN